MKREVVLRRAAFALAALVALTPFAARADEAAPPCRERAELLRLAHPLAHVARRLNSGAPITIVAIGSSSTQGAGASSPAANYPNRLTVELARHFPGHSFKMLNHGVGGEEVADMLRRFDDAVVGNKPDLVLWQLGTNSVIRDHKIGDHGTSIRDGIRRIRATGADVVLIDPQYAPKVIAKAEAPRMVELIAATAKLEGADVFRRFDVMKAWAEGDKLPFETFVVPDGLHMNDWGYACMAKNLGSAIAEAARRPLMSATAMPHSDW